MNQVWIRISTKTDLIIACHIFVDGEYVPALSAPRTKVIQAARQFKSLCTYFNDELSFTPQEFIGLTRLQALDVWIKRDIAYIRS